jgi:probable HAF family extracellular repeat protein
MQPHNSLFWRTAMSESKRFALYVLLISLLMPLAAAQIYTVTDLGTLGGSVSLATGINDLTRIVGQSSTVDDIATHPFLWRRNEGMQDLGTLGGSFSTASGINDLGKVVGWSSTVDFNTHAFLWTKTKGIRDLGTLGGCTSLAEAINFFGRVVGTSTTGCDSSSAFHAFIWTKAKGMQDLGTLGGCSSRAVGINDAGEVVGQSELDPTNCNDTTQHAFLWTKKDGMKDLGMPSNVGFGGLTAISSFGQIVATFCPEPCDGSEHGFTWTQQTGWMDLNDLIPADSGWVLVVPFGINAWGEIAGYGLINGQLHAFLLKPNICGAVTQK